MGDRRGVLVGKPEGKRPLENLGTGGKITLIGSSINAEAWIGLIWLRTETSGGRLGMR
jgi:hypothetical protein